MRLVVHGGAGARGTDAGFRDRMDAARSIADASFRLLVGGADARTAVVDAVARLEADPRFNAGLGSKLQADGVARLSASVMDGTSGRFSGVVNVVGVLHPVRLAADLGGEPDRVLAGEGARLAARPADLGDPVTELARTSGVCSAEA